MAGLIFGTAGTPRSVQGQGTVKGIERVRELGLGALEVEFTYGVKMGDPLAQAVGETAKKNKVSLSVHAPYYVNLCSSEKKKVSDSIQRIKDSIKRASIFGGKRIVFHTGFYQKKSKSEAYEAAKKRIEELAEYIEENSFKCFLAPETTGKESQLGSLDEVLSLYREVDKVKPCIDFSHLHARSQGMLTHKGRIEEVLGKIKDSGLHKEMHIHMSGIKYSDKGERMHLNMEEKENDFPWKKVLEGLKNEGFSGTVICESPNIELDSLLMQKYYSRLK